MAATFSAPSPAWTPLPALTPRQLIKASPASDATTIARSSSVPPNRTLRFLAKTIDTAAWPPVCTTSRVVQPNRKPVSGP